MGFRLQGCLRRDARMFGCLEWFYMFLGFYGSSEVAYTRHIEFCRILVRVRGKFGLSEQEEFFFKDRKNGNERCCPLTTVLAPVWKCSAM